MERAGRVRRVLVGASGAVVIAAGLVATPTHALAVDAPVPAQSTIAGVSASPARIVHGRTTTVSGRLLGRTPTGDWTALAGSPVTLRFRAPGSTHWAPVRSVRTGSDGFVHLRVTPSKSGTWRISYAGDATHRAIEGAPRSVSVSAVKSWVFGHSVRGRDLRVYRIGDPKAVRRVLVVGSLHGNEKAGVKVVSRLRVTAPSEGVVYFLVPNLNPDGAKASTRQNAHGVDLNRNFPRRWKARGHRWDTYYPGKRAASEPETRAAQRLIRSAAPSLTIWYHQHMNLVDTAGGPSGPAKSYGKATGMRVERLTRYRGSAATWQGYVWPTRSVVLVELPRKVSAAKAARHARAVRTVSVLTTT